MIFLYFMASELRNTDTCQIMTSSCVYRCNLNMLIFLFGMLMSMSETHTYPQQFLSNSKHIEILYYPLGQYCEETTIAVATK